MTPVAPSTYIAPLVESLRSRPTSVALAGQDRVLLTQVAVGLAKRLDPEFLWFDVRPRGSIAPRWQSALEFRIDPTRLHVLDAGDLRPDEPVTDSEGAGLITAAAESSRAESGPGFDATSMPSPVTLDDLSRIPEGIRRAAVETGPSLTPRVVLLTNVERASAAIDEAVGALRPYIEALNQAGVTIALTALSRPRANQLDVEMVLLLEPARTAPPVPAAVVCSMIRTAGLFPAIPPGSSYTAAAFARD